MGGVPTIPNWQFLLGLDTFILVRFLLTVYCVKMRTYELHMFDVSKMWSYDNIWYHICSMNYLWILREYVQPELLLPCRAARVQACYAPTPNRNSETSESETRHTRSPVSARHTNYCPVLLLLLNYLNIAYYKALLSFSALISCWFRLVQG